MSPLTRAPPTATAATSAAAPIQSARRRRIR
jgi:hypothetical protein